MSESTSEMMSEVLSEVLSGVTLSEVMVEVSMVNDVRRESEVTNARSEWCQTLKRDHVYKVTRAVEAVLREGRTDGRKEGKPFRGRKK
jgi:hypothetical protein